MPEYEHLTVELVDEVVFITFAASKLEDDSLINALAEECNTVIGETSTDKIALDFSGITFASSLVFGKVILLNKQVRQQSTNDYRLRLCSVADNIMDGFKLLNIAQSLVIVSDRAAVHESF